MTLFPCNHDINDFNDLISSYFSHYLHCRLLFPSAYCKMHPWFQVQGESHRSLIKHLWSLANSIAYHVRTEQDPECRSLVLIAQRHNGSNSTAQNRWAVYTVSNAEARKVFRSLHWVSISYLTERRQLFVWAAVQYPNILKTE